MRNLVLWCCECVFSVLMFNPQTFWSHFLQSHFLWLLVWVWNEMSFQTQTNSHKKWDCKKWDLSICPPSCWSYVIPNHFETLWSKPQSQQVELALRSLSAETEISENSVVSVHGLNTVCLVCEERLGGGDLHFIEMLMINVGAVIGLYSTGSG